VSQCAGDGWFAIDELTRDPSGITSLTLRFGGSCPGLPGFRGKVHWNAADTTPPVQPVVPVPAGLWDTSPAVGPHQSYVAIDSQTGDFIGEGADALYTKANSVLAVAEDGKDVKVSVTGDRSWTGTFRPMEVLESLEVGYYSPATGTGGSVNPRRGAMDWQNCGGGSSWFAVDQLTRSAGVISTLTIRFAVSCAGRPPLYGKVHWDAADTTAPSGAPEAIPGGLWDVADPVGPGLSYAVLDSDPGDLIAGGNDGSFSHANARVAVAESQGALKVQVDELSTWKGTFSTVPGAPLTVGYFGSPDAYPAVNPTSSAMAWTRGAPAASPTPCALVDGWFAIDQLTRSAGVLTSATIRFDITCDGQHHLKGKVRWLASDTTTPGMVTPVPGGLWDVTPPGVTGDYLFLDGVAGDPLTNGDGVLVSGPGSSVLAGDSEGRLDGFAGAAPELSAIYSFDGVDSLGTVQAGYYPNLSTATQDNPVLGGVAVDRIVNSQRVPCAAPRLGWFAVDKATRVDGHITQLDLRFEQSCNGAPAMHGRIHIDKGGLPAGPPVGALESVALVQGGVKLDGWALDPETASSIPVQVKVDGVLATTITADDDRPDIASANPLYGAPHGFGTTVQMSAGSHQLCVVAVNTGVGTDTVLDCRTVLVGAGSPFGSLDWVRAGLGSVSVSGWAIDPDTASSIPVHVYVDSSLTPLTADGSRPDVGAVFQGYGSAHGFSGQIAAAPGSHQVCAYGINTGVGANALIGCRTVVVPGGSPFGSLDLVSGAPGKVNVSGWAIDPDTAASIQVHVYVDSSLTPLAANGNRPDVGAVYPGYGPTHGFSAQITATPGAHQVCVYGINTGVGDNAPLGCRTVTVS
jgi:hypothetical protein